MECVTNSSAGVLGKMLSPQNLAVAAAAAAMAGREGELFRKLIGWSLGMLAVFTWLGIGGHHLPAGRQTIELPVGAEPVALNVLLEEPNASASGPGLAAADSQAI